MKFIFTFLAICLLGFSVFGQDETAKKEAYKVDETDASPSIKHIIQNIRDGELAENPTSKLYIINHGTPMLVEMRVKSLNRAFDFMPVDKSRVEFAPPVPYPFLMTEFWIVPEGAENPKPTIYAEKFGEISVANNKTVTLTIEKFNAKLNENPSLIGYFINYGTPKQKAVRVKQISDALGFLNCFGPRYVFYNGGSAKTIKTELWIVPPKR
jgi:hypothetical protein